MIIFVVGASGNTGAPLVNQLLDSPGNQHQVKVIVRSKDRFHQKVKEHPNLTVLEAVILDLSDSDLEEYVSDCEVVVSCLGHVGSFSGIFGQPRQLCTDAVKKLCATIKKTSGKGTLAEESKRKLILMSTVLVCNPELKETRGFGDRLILGILHYALPPHYDNETAAAYLVENVGKENEDIEWCIVRPDLLIDGEVSKYIISESPTSAIISGGIETTRSNVANFMMKLIENANLWEEWTFRMPCIKNDVNEVESPS